MAGLLNLLHEPLHHLCTLTSLLLERTLSYIYSSLFTPLASFGKINGTSTATDRAWWDTNKGSAVVVWAPGDQTISQALALSLASVHANLGSKRAGRPPYTVIVVLPSSSRGLASLISAWATRKASIEGGMMRGSDHFTPWDFFGLGSLSLRLGSPESSWGDGAGGEETAASDGSSDGDRNRPGSGCRSSTSSRPTTPGHRRRLSLGGWSAPDLVGALKGLTIGQSESKGIGAVIPVVADTSTAEGIADAHSTIRAYCTSHDLLLRALVVLPSILTNTYAPSSSNSPAVVPSRPNQQARQSSGSRSREVTKTLESDELMIQSQAGGTSPLSKKSLDSTQAALASDVGETMNVVASLVPALKSDGGRVVAIVPSAFRNMERVEEPWERYSSEVEIVDDDGLEFDVTRRAMLEMWSNLQKRLALEGVHLSQIHMSAPRKERSGKYYMSGAKPPAPSGLQQVARHIFAKLHYLLYPVPLKGKQPKIYLDSEAPRLRDDSNSTDACPALLLDAVRSVLVRSWPRPHYCVGLGPHLEAIWECIPGHHLVRSWIVDRL